MNVITLASRKGGAGKSTLTAHLAAYAQRAGHRCLIIDADPQGSLTLWHSLRTHGRLPLQSATRGIDRAIAFAATDAYEWVFVDTAPTMWVVVQEAIRVATLVIIPARPGFFDLASIHETIAAAREREKPFAVVINAAPPKRDDKGITGSDPITQLSQSAGHSGLGGTDQSSCRLLAEPCWRRQRMRVRAWLDGGRRDLRAVVRDRTLGRSRQCRACGRPRKARSRGLVSSHILCT
jgi:cellulose biosynthesis protein BcsQ